MADIPALAGERPVADIRAAHLSEAEQAKLSQAVLARQWALSVRVAVIFLTVLLGLPILNWLAPSLMSVPIGGFTLTWLLLAVLFYPLTWLLSGYFIRASDKIERQLAVEHRAEIDRDGRSQTERSAAR